MVKRLHLPSVIWCAIGFAMAGCGIGSLVGLPLGPWLYAPLPENAGAMDKYIAMYGGVYFGIKVGIVGGAVIGVLYAVLVRRSRLRRQVANA